MCPGNSCSWSRLWVTDSWGKTENSENEVFEKKIEKKIWKKMKKKSIFLQYLSNCCSSPSLQIRGAMATNLRRHDLPLRKRVHPRRLHQNWNENARSSRLRHQYSNQLSIPQEVREMCWHGHGEFDLRQILFGTESRWLSVCYRESVKNGSRGFVDCFEYAGVWCG